jgi:hypothetical protein
MYSQGLRFEALKGFASIEIIARIWDPDPEHGFEYLNIENVILRAMKI